MSEDSDRIDQFFDRLQKAVFTPSLSSDENLYLSDIELEAGESVGHYRIISLIGRGGMGTVYRAHDTRLDREVALKFLPSYIGANSGEQDRLLLEARAAAALDHPNVCSIHEIGDTSEGRRFIAMPYYEGETLKERLRRGPMSVDESVSIAMQVANALATAHSRGIIHRDVKPGNVILVSGGTVRLLDFGLATPLDASRMSAAVTPGTISYMSPEQVRSVALDARTDLWSLGVVMYEMLAGARPFSGEDRAHVLRAILHHEPEPLSRRRPEVPEALSAIVARLLQKDPDNRYESASALTKDLTRRAPTDSSPVSPRRVPLIAGVLILAFVVAAGAWWSAKDRSSSALPPPNSSLPSLAVLPLTHSGADSANAALATGIMEDLITTLGSSGNVRVIASTSVARFRNPERDIRSIADSLGVGNVLEGGIQKVGSRVRIQMRLIDGRDGSTRWSELYEREFSELFAVQDEIVRAVAGELDLRFDRDGQRARHRTSSMRAYELYLRGADPVLLRSQAGIWKAQELFQQAIAADSTFAAAHAWLALTYVRRARNANDPGMPVPKLLELADVEARKAIALDSNLADAFYSLGRVREAMLDVRSAEQAVRRAIQLDPNRSVYWRSLSFLQPWFSRPEQELAYARRALQTDPLNPYAVIAVASGHYGMRQYGEALAQLEGVASLKPPLQGAMFAIAQCQAKLGRLDEAISTLRPGAEAGDPLFNALLGHMLARAGNTSEASRILDDLKARHARNAGGAFHVAVVYAGFNDLDQTFGWLDKSVDDLSISSFIMGPTFEDIQRDPRFSRLKKRLGLE